MPAPTASNNQVPSGQLVSQKPIVLWFHDTGTFANHDAVVNPEYFPNIRDGQLLRIHAPHSAFVVKATCVDRESLARQQNLQISVSKDIAERFNLRFRIEVYVELIDAASVALDYVELSFKEQYLGRSDMWRLQQSLHRTCVYAEKKILFAGVIKATVRRLFSDDTEVLSGYVDENTRMIFRSGSAKYFLFIQLSREMWEFDEDGELYFEKVVNNFLPHLFTRWKEEGTNHVVSIVLFTRVYYDTDDPLDDMVCKTDDGRYYKDFYKVIADWESTDDWMSVIKPLKEEQLTFQQNVLMRQEDGRSILCGRLSAAYDGNVLEAVNLALNPFDNHYVDRDLMRTGLSIILITPGVGKFAVDKKLLRVTNERMTDNGIAMDLVCLSPLPLHVTPLFVYRSAPPPAEIQEHLIAPRQPKTTTAANSPEVKMPMKLSIENWDPLYQDDDLAPTHTYYSVPHWIDCSFYHHETGRFIKQDKFRTRCKMYELQMMGIMEHDLASINIPYLPYTNHSLRSRKSSSSLNDKTSAKSVEHLGNGETYLSRSANFSSLRRPSFLMSSEQESRTLHIDYDKYDNSIFKDTSEPRFGRKAVASQPLQKVTKQSGHRNSLESPDKSENDVWLSRQLASKSGTTTWHHSDQRRVISILSQSQQASGKITFDSNVRKEDHPPRASEIFKGASPNRDDISVRIKPSRRGTMNSNDVKVTAQITAADAAAAAAAASGVGNAVDEEDMLVVSSSTVDPVPINNKGIGRPDSRSKSTNPSPRQNAIAGSLPSIHKHSGNSDLIRTSFGANRSSPSHNWSTRSTAMRNALISPCNPADYTLIFTSHLRRWLHALPKADQCQGTSVHWRSLVSPACLPLTTDYFPSNEELKMCYNHYMYTVSASEDVNLYQAGDRSLSEHKKTANLLTELISQRLAQGFQIIVDITGNSSNLKPVSKVMAAGETPGNTAMPSVGSKEGKDTLISSGSANGKGGTQEENSTTNWKHMVWWLSMGHQVHQLTFDSSGQNVEVRRYVRILEFDDKEKIWYKCVIWHKNIPQYRPKQVAFGYPSLMYAWNYLDHLVAGYQEELTDNLRFWRARFIVIPRETLPNNAHVLGVSSHDNLDEEEKRLALFDMWLQNLKKAKWLTPHEREEMQKRRKKELGYIDFGLKITTMDPSAYILSEAVKSEQNTPSQQHSSLLSSIGSLGQPLTRDSKSKDIAAAMRDPKMGVKICDRRWHFKVFRDSFVGNEMVDWLISQFDDISTREEAVAFGNALMERKPPLFASSSGRHGFMDGHYFYRLHPDFVPHQRSQKPWFAINTSGSALRKSVTPSSESTSSSSTDPPRRRRTQFEMSRSVIIDVDPYKKSNRRETAILHYDTLHNPNNCYHFQLNWLGCTAQLVQELVVNWSRQAERCGLLVVEGSVDQAYEDSENNNPFQSPVPINFAVLPPPISDLEARYELPDNFYAAALVRHLGFVLDVEADSKFDRAKAEGVDVQYSYIHAAYKYDQYIHRSGVAFVQIRQDNKGLYWVNNRLYTNHTPSLAKSRRRDTSSAMHPELLRQNVEEFCADAKRLKEFWEATRNSLTQGQSGVGTWVFENVTRVPEDTEEQESPAPSDITMPNFASPQSPTKPSPNV